MAILPSACARPGPSGTRPRPCSPGDRSPGRARPETARGQAGGRIHLQDRLRCLGRHRRKNSRKAVRARFQILRIFNKDVLPTLGKMSIYDIRRPSSWASWRRSKAQSVHHRREVRTWFNQMFRYALVIAEGLEVNPAADLDVVAEQPRWPTAPTCTCPRCPSSFRGSGSTTPWLADPAWRPATVLTGVRTGELRLAEPEQFDLDRGLWIIPPQIVKQLQDEMRKAGKRPQDVPPIVPLSLQAIEIVRYLLGAMRPAQYLLSHRSELKKRISENTLNKALQLMGYEGRLTGHGIRGTISAALNEIGYPKIWVDAQLSHSDPNKVSSAYNHAKYVEPRRRMMQDWADRLDLLEQGEVGAARRAPDHPYRRGAGDGGSGGRDGRGPAVAEQAPSVARQWWPRHRRDPEQRRDHVPAAVAGAATADACPGAEVSAIQRERNAGHVRVAEQPAGPAVRQAGRKIQDQINRELKAGKLLSISLGNRGQRVPDWQLVPLKHRLAQVLMNQYPHADSWDLYRMLTQPHPDLGDRAAIDTVTPTNVPAIIRVITGDYQHHADTPETIARTHPRGCAAKRPPVG